MILFLPPTVYLVEPTNALLGVEALSQSLRSFLAEPKVWQNEEGSSELTASEREAVAKRVILAYFLSFQEVDELLGKPDVSEQTFNRYWHLRRLPIEGSLHHLAAYAKRIDKERIISTGSDFLDRVVGNMLNSTENSQLQEEHSS